MAKKVSIVTMNPYFSIKNANSAVSLYLKTIGDFLKTKGYEVTYFPDPTGSTSFTSASTGFLSKVKQLFKKVFPGYYFRKRFQRYFSDVEELHQKALIELKNSDVVIEFSSYGGSIGSELKQRYPIKLIAIYDAPLPLQFEEMYQKTGKFSSLIRDAERKFVQDADLVICYSDAVKAYLTKNYKIHSVMEVMPCIVWKEELLPLDNQKTVIGFIGSFLQWHQPLLLVKAFEQIADQFPMSELVMVGYGEEWQSTHDYCSQSRYKNRIKLTGFVSEAELTRIRASFTIGVMPGSNWYGSPLKLFEYAQNGISVIAPTTPTVQQYFKHQENALLIDPKNELNDLIAHLKSYLSDATLRERMSMAGLRMMNEELSMEQVMTRFVGQIEKIQG